jgi:hypothetical protein
MAEMEKRGIIVDDMNGALTDFKTGARWLPVIYPHIWMYPPLSRGMECYYRLTGNEDARDWVIAYGQAVAHLFYQEQHYAIHDKGGCHHHAHLRYPVNIVYFFHLVSYSHLFDRSFSCRVKSGAFGATHAQYLYFFHIETCFIT